METSLLFWGSAFIVIVCGLVLLVWALFADRSRGRRRCPRCWHSMQGSPSLRCAECGRVAKSEKKLRKTRRRLKWAMASIVPILFAGYLAIQPKVRQDGWASVMPATMLILALNLSDNDWALDALQDRTSDQYVFPVTFHVAHKDTLYQWQWQTLGRTAARLLNNRDESSAKRKAYLFWLGYASAYVENTRVSRELHAEIIRLFDDSDPAIRSVAAMCSVNASHAALSLARLQELMDDPEPRVRVGAVSAMRLVNSQTQSGIATSGLIDATNDADARVRSLALGALGAAVGYLDNWQEVKLIVEGMRSDPSGAVRERWPSVMCRILSKDHCQQLLRDLLIGDDAALRRGSLWEMGEDPELLAEAIEDVIAALLDGDAGVREAAAYALENVPARSLIDHETTFSRFLDEYKDDPVVEAAAVEALSRIEQIKNEH